MDLCKKLNVIYSIITVIKSLMMSKVIKTSLHKLSFYINHENPGF